MHNRIRLSALLATAALPALLAAADKPSVRVMTYNLDAGTDLNFVLGATDAVSLAKGLALTWAEVLSAQIPERAALTAAEIEKARPDVIALQEVTTWRKGKILSPPATEVVYDQLDLLLAALAKRKLNYTVVAVQTLMDVEAPNPADGIDIRITDRDVILARNDLPQSEMDVTNIRAKRYASTFVFGSDLLGQLAIYRGWMSADVTLRGSTFRFVNTHMESPIPGLPAADQTQLKQAGELVAALNDAGMPVILAGDFNSNADLGPDHFDTNQVIIAGGFADAWRAVYPGIAGNTWPTFGEDQFAGPATPVERIDLIYTRATKPTGFSRGLNVLGIERVGTTAPFPSDHAGVVATLRLE
jgi:endonuclease/exonuclease/phosphatase family metal-dependent hydrolase